MDPEFANWFGGDENIRLDVRSHEVGLDPIVYACAGEYAHNYRWKSGEALKLSLPAGTHRWVIHGDGSSMSGEFRVGADGSRECRIDFDGAGELSVMSFEFEGFSTEERRFIDISAESLDRQWCNRMYSRAWLDDRRVVYEIEPVWEVHVEAGMPEGSERGVIFAPPGKYEVRIGFNGLETEVVMECPGKVVVRRADILEPQALGEVSVLDDDERFFYRLQLDHADGRSFAHQIGKSFLLHQGKWRAFVLRSDYESEGADAYRWAETTFTLTDEPLEFDPRKLEWHPMAQVNFEFRGGDDKGGAQSAWWSPFHEYRGPYLRALGHDGEAPYIPLGAPSDIRIRGGMKLLFPDRLLAPGRYRVVPWYGAPDSECVEIKVTAGAALQTIVIDCE
jgi:hypothetical protein